MSDKVDALGGVVKQIHRKIHRTAGQDLLATFEVAEQILLQVDERKILSLQRFSQFKAIIDGSPLLGRKIFNSSDNFEVPFQRPRINYLPFRSVEDGKEFALFNSLRPALARDGHEYKLVLHSGRPFPSASGRDATRDPVRVLKAFDIRHWQSNNVPHGSCICLRFYMLRATSEEQANAKGYLWERDGGLGAIVTESWQRMYVSQPPLLEIRWAAFDCTPGRDREKEPLAGIVPAGTTFGDLLTEGKGLGWHGIQPKPTYAQVTKK